MKTYNSVELVELIDNEAAPFKGCDFKCYLNGQPESSDISFEGGQFYLKSHYGLLLLPISTKFGFKEPFMIKKGKYEKAIISFHGVNVYVDDFIFNFEKWTHIACDKGGDVYLYNYKPEVSSPDKVWICQPTDGRSWFSCTTYHVATIDYTGDWEYSLLALSDCTIEKDYLARNK